MNGNPLPTFVGEMHVFYNTIYFSGSDSTHGQELWKCDGTNMTRVTDLAPGSASSSPLSMIFYHGLMYFMANDGTGNGLWKFDGTNATRIGTMILNTVNNLLIYNDAILMGAAASGTDFEPWKYDGTNFTFIGEVNAFGTNATPIFWTNYHNLACFSAGDGIHGNGAQLWTYDGTNLTRWSAFAGSGGIYQFVFNDTLYFMANDGLTGYELWKFDGSNVSQVADIEPGYLGSNPEPLAQFNNTFMFEANDGTYGTELWRLDPLSSVYAITNITTQGNDLLVSWITPSGWTNVIQAANSLSGANPFADASPQIVATNGTISSASFLDAGAAKNHTPRYYRLRTAP
jgi:ELWxxDGT repeat protein